MKKFLAILSIGTVIFGAWANNLFAQDAEEGTVIITAQDEEFCPFCNAIAAAQANGASCLIVVQAPDGSMQATNCPAPTKDGKDGKTCDPKKTCPKCKTKMPVQKTAQLSQEELRTDKALHN